MERDGYIVVGLYFSGILCLYWHTNVYVASAVAFLVYMFAEFIALSLVTFPLF